MKSISKLISFILYLSLFLSSLFQIAQSGKSGKLAKNVLRGGVLKAVGAGKHYRSPHAGRVFPVWAIVLLVIGSSAALGLVIFLLCYFRQRRPQTCCPQGQLV